MTGYLDIGQVSMKAFFALYKWTGLPFGESAALLFLHPNIKYQFTGMLVHPNFTPVSPGHYIFTHTRRLVGIFQEEWYLAGGQTKVAMKNDLKHLP